MSNITKIKLEDEVYKLSLPSDGTLNPNNFVSLDDESASSWTDTNRISETDTHSTIFYKLTSMIKNIRYLHSRVALIEQSMFISDPNGYRDVVSGVTVDNFNMVYNNQGIAMVNMTMHNTGSDLRSGTAILYLTHLPVAESSCTIIYNNNQTIYAKISTNGSITPLANIKKSNTPVYINFMYSI